MSSLSAHELPMECRTTRRPLAYRIRSAATLAFCTALGLALIGFEATAAPGPLSPRHSRLFHGSPADVLDKPTCGGGKGRLAAGLACRDARHHLHTNEWHHYVFTRRIKGLGGAYVGVGADQQLTFVAAARAELAWLLDYDPAVVALNRVHEQLILAAKTPRELVEMWARKSENRVLALLDSKTELAVAERELLKRTYRTSRKWLQTFFQRVWQTRKRRPYHWLHDPAGYAHIRALFAARRIRIMGGDLLKDKALVGIGKVAHQLGMPIHVLYLSNAEEYWRYTKQYRANMRALYFDERSVVLRCRTSRKGPIIGRYQYVLQGGQDFQRRIGQPAIRGVWSMLQYKRPGRPRGFFTIGL